MHQACGMLVVNNTVLTVGNLQLLYCPGTLFHPIHSAKAATILVKVLSIAEQPLLVPRLGHLMTPSMYSEAGVGRISDS